MTDDVEKAVRLQRDARLRGRAQTWAKTVLSRRHEDEYHVLYYQRLAQLRAEEGLDE